MPESSANVLVIAEHNIANPRQIVLRGRSLPFQEVAWPTKQRVDINYFPGNPVAIAQVIGATWEDTTISGKWSDIHLISDENAPDLINFDITGTNITPSEGAVTEVQSAGAIPAGRGTTAEVVRDAMYKLCRGGQLLRVEWGSLVRFGYIGEFTPRHDRREDISWEIRFVWIGDKATQPRPQPQSASLPSVVTFVNVQAQGIVEFLGASPLFTNQHLLRITQFVRKIQSFVNDLLSTLERIISTRAPISPRDLFGNTRGALNGIIDSVNEVLSTFEARGSAIARSRDTGGNPAEVTIIDIFERRFRRLAVRLAAECRIQQRNVERFFSPKIKTIVRAISGTTLRDISIQEYGTADNWRAIQDFNGFPDSQVPAGTLVRVPEIPTMRSRQPRELRETIVGSLEAAGVI